MDDLDKDELWFREIGHLPYVEAVRELRHCGVELPRDPTAGDVREALVQRRAVHILARAVRSAGGGRSGLECLALAGMALAPENPALSAERLQRERASLAAVGLTPERVVAALSKARTITP